MACWRIGARKLGIDRRGVAAVEFAFAAPLILAMLFGILQIGLLMLAYNGIRSLAGEMGRYAVVQYMTGNELSDSQIETAVIARGVRAGSGLNADNLQVNAATALVSSVPGVKQIDLTITYSVPNVLPFWPGEGFQIDVEKPVMVYADFDPDDD
jgi:Flp pilus assembly protein TadG